jgi:hypothetical protein
MRAEMSPFASFSMSGASCSLLLPSVTPFV